MARHCVSGTELSPSSAKINSLLKVFQARLFKAADIAPRSGAPLFAINANEIQYGASR